MRRAFGFSLSLIALVSFITSDALAAGSNKSLATISGTVRDNRGNPLAGALVSLMREGFKTVKEARTDKHGNFITKVLPGRYGIKAIAYGFSEVVFTEVDVKAQQELVYRFNLEPVGSGRTLPERRRDRDDVKWTLRSVHNKRSIFQVNEGEDATVKAVTEAEAQTAEAAPMESAPEVPSYQRNKFRFESKTPWRFRKLFREQRVWRFVCRIQLRRRNTGFGARRVDLLRSDRSWRCAWAF